MTDKTLQLPRLVRDFAATVMEARQKDNGPLELTFSASSDAPLDRYYGTEILSHAEGAVRMDRINGGSAPLLFNHNWDDPVGMIDGGRLEGGRMIVDAHLFETARGREVRAMIEGGLRNVSVGYEIHEVAEDKKANSYEATAWTPYEVSLCTIPADASVGLGRSADKSITKPVRVITRATQKADAAETLQGASMAEEKNAPAGAAAATLQVNENGTHEQRMSAVEIEARRKQAISNLCRANKLDAQFEREWIAGGASLDQVAEDMIKIMEERGRAQPAAGLGMTRKEVSTYSMVRAMHAAHTGDWSKAGFERECSRAISDKRGIIPRQSGAFFVPMEVQARNKRDMTVAGVSGSQYLVGTDNQPGSFIDLLRNEAVSLAMGATRLTGLVGNITIPRMTAAGTAYWLADESTQITESQPTIGQLSLSPKDVAALTQISHKLMSQSTPDVEQMIMNDLAAVLGLAIDVAVLRGSGSNGQPHGIVGTSGLGSFDTDSTDPFGDVVSAQVDVMAANALRPGCAYVADPASAALLMGRSRFSSTDTPVWDGSLLSGTMAGFPCRATNQMSANTMLFGLWPSIIVAEWGQLELVVNQFSDETRGLVSVRAWYQMDTGMRYPAAFSYDASVA